MVGGAPKGAPLFVIYALYSMISAIYITISINYSKYMSLDPKKPQKAHLRLRQTELFVIVTSISINICYFCRNAMKPTVPFFPDSSEQCNKGVRL